MKTLVIGVAIFALFFILFALFTYSVDETEVAIKLRFGKILDVSENAGLHFKVPFVDNIEKRDKRVMLYDISPESILTSDKKRLEVDSYVLWKINEAQKFIETMNTVLLAQTRIDDIVYSNLRDSFAKLFINDIISEDRIENLLVITEKTDLSLGIFGIKVLDVNVKRTDLPETNAKAVFERMRSERSKAAAAIRAEGEKQAKDIYAKTDKEAEIILATAQKTAEDMKGIGDARALEIYAKSYSKDPEFYRFWRTLGAYETAFGSNTSLVLGKEMDFLKEFIRATK